MWQRAQSHLGVQEKSTGLHSWNIYVFCWQETVSMRNRRYRLFLSEKWEWENAITGFIKRQHQSEPNIIIFSILESKTSNSWVTNHFCYTAYYEFLCKEEKAYKQVHQNKPLVSHVVVWLFSNLGPPKLMGGRWIFNLIPTYISDGVC